MEISCKFRSIFFLQCLLTVVIFVLHLTPMEFWYIFIPTFFKVNIYRNLNFVKALNITTKYGQHLSKKKNHCFWRFTIHNFQFRNYFTCKKYNFLSPIIELYPRNDCSLVLKTDELNHQDLKNLEHANQKI